jgi:hypothetical protein
VVISHCFCVCCSSGPTTRPWAPCRYLRQQNQHLIRHLVSHPDFLPPSGHIERSKPYESHRKSRFAANGMAEIRSTAMNGHRQTGSTGPFRVHFHPRCILANKAARNDFLNCLGNFSESFFGFRKPRGGGRGGAGGGPVVIVADRWRLKRRDGQRSRQTDRRPSSRFARVCH